ncbi:hypothetical protein [Gracilibacillus saliphilus]|uniref:hypothetical protein n=1 Tax=Gracilibacillus saliphilus TaxID=543890 RepID=UPI0013D7BC88|nr:hypothetical protein [Gracilibacillus saliphilus]
MANQGIKAVVIKAFKDENRNRHYVKDAEYFHHEQKRIDELVKGGFIKVVPNKKTTSSKSKSSSDV